MPTPRYYVYVLARPDGTPFYVGKGSGRRVFDHEREAASGCNCAKCIIIRNMWQKGEQMQRLINFATSDEAVALQHERELIQQYRHFGLCNKQYLPPIAQQQSSTDNCDDYSFNPEEHFKPEQAATILGMSCKAVIALMMSGQLEYIQLGTRLQRIPLSAINAKLQAAGKQPMK